MPFLQSRLRRLRDNLRAYRAAWTRHAEWANWPALIERPPGQRVLVLAPHPDDDAIGCGGTLAKHVAAGDRVTCVYLANGSQGDPDSPDPFQAAHIRRQEAETAAQVLGLDDLVFLDQPDSTLAATSELIEALLAVLADRRPDLVYVPFCLDPSSDHRAANDVLAAAVVAGDLDFRYCIYETWAPLMPNVLVDISAQMERKLAAIRCYQSQVRQVDYVRLVEGLNAYRTMQFAGRIRYAEAFYLAGVHDYLALIAEVKTTQCAS